MRFEAHTGLRVLDGRIQGTGLFRMPPRQDRLSADKKPLQAADRDVPGNCFLSRAFQGRESERDREREFVIDLGLIKTVLVGVKAPSSLHPYYAGCPPEVTTFQELRKPQPNKSSCPAVARLRVCGWELKVWFFPWFLGRGFT